MTGERTKPASAPSPAPKRKGKKGKEEEEPSQHADGDDGDDEKSEASLIKDAEQKASKAAKAPRAHDSIVNIVVNSEDPEEVQSRTIVSKSLKYDDYADNDEPADSSDYITTEQWHEKNRPSVYQRCKICAI